jgi:hypothetical protein
MGNANFIATRGKRFLSTSSGTVGILFALAAVPEFSPLAWGLIMFAPAPYRRGCKARSMRRHWRPPPPRAWPRPIASNSPRRSSKQNWEADPSTKDLDVDPVFTIAQGAITGAADIEMPTALMQLAGIEKMAIGSDVTVTIPRRRVG